MIEQLYKPYLVGKKGYKGGKAVNEIKTKAAKIYKLSSNENPLGSSPKAVEALQNSLNNLHIYPDRTGIRLQNALADFYDHQLTSEHFVATNSGSEVIEFIARGFLSETSEVIVSNPTFFPYTMFSGWNGAKVVNVPLVYPDFSLDVAGILAAINENTRLVFLTTPNNPTGTHISKATLEKLLHQLPDHVILVMDEVYYHFVDAPDYTTALPYILEGKNIIAINSFSKTYGLAALRMGYAYTTPEIAHYLRQLYRPFLINTLSLNAAIAALSDRAFIDATVDLVQRERERIYPILEELGLKYWKTQANFIYLEPEESPVSFTEKMQQEGIMIRPVKGFGASKGVRITIGNEEANDAMLSALRKIKRVGQ